MKKTVLRSILYIAIVLLFTSPCFAEEKESIVRVGYYENEVFEEGASEGAVKTGYAYEYYRKLSEYTGWEYEYVYGSYGDLYQMLLDGKIDLLAGLAWKSDREEVIAYPDAAMGKETYNLVKHDTDDDISDEPSTLTGKKIGVLESALSDTLKKYLDERGVKADIVTFGDYSALFDAFDKHNVDVLAAEGDGAYGREHAEVLFSFGASEYYLCVNINRSDILKELNEAQEELYEAEPNYMDLLRSKYYPESMSSKVFSAAEKEWINTHGTLNVGYLNNYLPYSDTDEKGEPDGIIQEIIPCLCDNLGIKNINITYSGYDNYDDMIAAVRDGSVDLVFPVGGGLYYSEENGIYQSNAVVSTSTELVYADEYSEDKLKSFAVNSSNSMQYYYVKTNFPDAEIKLYDSIEDCLEAVIAGKVCCTTLNGLRANDIIKNSRYRGLYLKQLNKADDRCFGVKIGNEGLLKLLNRGMNIVGEEFVQDLSYNYTDKLYKYTFADFLSDNAGIITAVIVGAAALLILFLIYDAKRTKKQMMDKENARLELERKNKELAENRKALSDALIAAKHANNAKTTFLNNMSHDIRTPMNAIVGFTTLAASHIDNREQVLDYLGKISVSSSHLLSLINDVLDMSRIESGNVKIDDAEVHLPELIRDIRIIIQPNITSKQLELFIDTQDVVHEDIITDKLRLNQVLLNILSNAIKFTPAGGTISFRVIEKPSSSENTANFEFCIKDNGIGMSEEFQKNIFEAFTREKSTTVSGIQGTGLGMAISKNIVDMMGGNISVKSKQGEGSEFRVFIPCKISGVQRKYENLPELKGLRVLVADDDTNTCLSVCSMLREIGMRPDWTNYGKEAVIRAKDAYEHSDEFDTYIIDWMMPDLNGIETVRRIRRVIGESAPIIILTAYDWSDIEEEAIEAGVTAFCSKPIFMSELRDVLSKPYKQDSGNYSDEVPDLTGKRILLAEDNELNRQIATAILENAGCEVVIAMDGSEAVDKIKNSPADTFDIILMDVQMPHMDGYEATRLIRALDDSTKANIPIIAVTANAFDEDKKIAAQAGMNEHLAKPYDVPVMLQTIYKLIYQ